MACIPVFHFEVKWEELEERVNNNLRQASEEDRQAAAQDIAYLRKFLFRKLCSLYLIFRADNPGVKKYPGRLIYRDVADQVLRKYPGILTQTVRGTANNNGAEWFAMKLEQSVLNKIKSKPERGPSDDDEEDDDSWDGIPREDQEALKASMQDAPGEAEWEDMQCHMADTFDLRKQDLQTLKGAGDWPQNVMEQWPFLCTPEGVNQHLMVATGVDLQEAYDVFVSEERDHLLNFSITSTTCAIKNLAARLKFDEDEDMAMLHVVANIFKEDVKKLVFTVMDLEENDSDDSEDWQRLNLPAGYPCIVQKGPSNFKVCLRQKALISATSTAQAIVTLVNMCHVLKVDYPPIPKTMEFLEGFVLLLPIEQTKILKKAKPIKSLSQPIMTVIKKIEEFKTKLEEASHQLD